MVRDHAPNGLAIDSNTEFGARVLRHLQEDAIVWLTTVGPDNTPQPSPVWFYWDGETVLVYSQPHAPKVRNIARGSRVSLTFNSTPSGDDVVVLTGDAWLDEETSAADANAAYLEKYRESLQQLEMSLEDLAREYSLPVRVRPTAVRGH